MCSKEDVSIRTGWKCTPVQSARSNEMQLTPRILCFIRLLPPPLRCFCPSIRVKWLWISVSNCGRLKQPTNLSVIFHRLPATLFFSLWSFFLPSPKGPFIAFFRETSVVVVVVVVAANGKASSGQGISYFRSCKQIALKNSALNGGDKNCSTLRINFSSETKNKDKQLIDRFLVPLLFKRNRSCISFISAFLVSFVIDFFVSKSLYASKN